VELLYFITAFVRCSRHTYLGAGRRVGLSE
jgi:hypothetical protein